MLCVALRALRSRVGGWVVLGCRWRRGVRGLERSRAIAKQVTYRRALSPLLAQRVVLHIDMDAFFASVEQRDDPRIRGVPVIVGADPRRGEGRGVVAAASYEAREKGVRSALPISTAWRLCPEGVYLRPRIGHYAAVSREVFALLEGAVDAFEPASIDEAYADVTGRAGGSYEVAARLAGALQRRVRDLFDLSCSIGIGPNKLVAKIASDLDKPAGLTVVEPSQVAGVLGPLPARVIPGVGPKTGEALADAFGVTTVTELAAQGPERLAERFGVWGPEMIRLAQGLDDRPVDPHWEPKSVGAEETFLEDLPAADAPAELAEVANEATGRLRREGDQARTITLKVRLADFETFTRARTLPVPTDDPAVVGRIAQALLAEAQVAAPVRLLGVRLSGLARGAPRQATLLAWPADILGEEAPREFRGRPPRWRF